jgi:energy-coupling factor transporter transmembrane protein EcfT
MSLLVSRNLLLLVGMLLFLMPLFWIARVPKKTVIELVIIASGLLIGMSITLGFIPATELNLSWRFQPTGITFRLGPLTYYYDQFIYALAFTLKTSIPLFLAVGLLTSTTDPQELLVCLSKIGIPDDVAFVVSTAFRLIPIFTEEWANIRDAILVRGAKSRGMGWIKLQGLMLEPLVVGALRRSREMSFCVEARAFGSRRRTHMKESILRRTDYGVIAFCIGLVCLFSIFGGLGLGLI